MLLEALDVSYLASFTDLEKVLDQNNIIKPQHLGRARWLLVEDKFKIWLAPKQNDFLLVDGYCAEFGVRRISPLSVFVASLAVSMTQTLGVISLTFFCSEHFTGSDSLSGPAGLIRSLILQLLLQCPKLPEPNLDFISEDLFDQIWEFNLSALCYLFRLLVERIEQHMTIYCLIDNISELEGSIHGWRRELHYLIEKLIDIAEDDRIPAIFKLLVTCGHRSIDVVSLFPKPKHIQLQTENSHHSAMSADGITDDFQNLVLSSSEGELEEEDEWEYSSRFQKGKQW